MAFQAALRCLALLLVFVAVTPAEEQQFGTTTSMTLTIIAADANEVLLARKVRCVTSPETPDCAPLNSDAAQHGDQSTYPDLALKTLKGKKLYSTMDKQKTKYDTYYTQAPLSHALDYPSNPSYPSYGYSGIYKSMFGDSIIYPNIPEQTLTVSSSPQTPAYSAKLENPVFSSLQEFVPTKKFKREAAQKYGGGYGGSYGSHGYEAVLPPPPHTSTHHHVPSEYPSKPHPEYHGQPHIPYYHGQPQSSGFHVQSHHVPSHIPVYPSLHSTGKFKREAAQNYGGGYGGNYGDHGYVAVPPSPSHAPAYHHVSEYPSKPQTEYHGQHHIPNSHEQPHISGYHAQPHIPLYPVHHPGQNIPPPRPFIPAHASYYKH